MSKTLDPKSSAYTNFATLAKLLLNFKMVSHTGIEPVTPWLKVKCSTDWANGSQFGAGDEGRTRDIQLGRLTLYQLSYSRIIWLWCLGPDLNRHGIIFHRILSPVRLPISPPRHNPILIFFKILNYSIIISYILFVVNTFFLNFYFFIK